MPLIPVTGWRVVGLAAIVAVVAPGLPPMQAAGPPVPAPAQDGPSIIRQIRIGTGAIAGTVIAADTGLPLRNVAVFVTGSVDGEAEADVWSLTQSRDRSAVAPFHESRILSRETVTDSAGRFLLDRLPASRYRVTAFKPGFLGAGDGPRASGRAAIMLRLEDGQQINLSLALAPLGAISGIVTIDGEPSVGASVQLYRFDWSTGVRRLMVAARGTTDDRGSYRFGTLQPGEYVVAAAPAANALLDRARALATAFDAAVDASVDRTASVATVATYGNPNAFPGYAPTFFPATPLAGAATSVVLEPGDTREDVHIQAEPIRNGRVGGRVALPPDVQAGVQVTLVSDEAGIGPVYQFRDRVSEAGRFYLPEVPPGRYTAHAFTLPRQHVPFSEAIVGRRPEPPPEPVAPYAWSDGARPLWGIAPVVVQSGVMSDVEIELRPGRTISGRVVFESGQPMEWYGGSPLVVGLTSPPSSSEVRPAPFPRSDVGHDGRFRIDDVMPGRYLFDVWASLRVVSAIVDGVDTLDFPFAVTDDRDVEGALLTVSDRSTELTVRLTDASGEPADGYTLVAFTTDRRYWTPDSRRVAVAQGDVFRNLPPGTYHLAAVADLEDGRHYDPAFLAALVPASVTVTIAAGRDQVQNLRVAD